MKTILKILVLIKNIFITIITVPLYILLALIILLIVGLELVKNNKTIILILKEILKKK